MSALADNTFNLKGCFLWFRQLYILLLLCHISLYSVWHLCKSICDFVYRVPLPIIRSNMGVAWLQHFVYLTLEIIVFDVVEMLPILCRRSNKILVLPTGLWGYGWAEAAEATGAEVMVGRELGDRLVVGYWCWSHGGQRTGWQTGGRLLVLKSWWAENWVTDWW